MSISFDFKPLVDQRKTVKQELQNRVNDLMYKHSFEMFNRILKRTPYCTGAMMEGWTYEPHTSTKGWVIIEIGNSVPYAKYVNDGTVESDGNFAVEISLHETLQNLNRDLRRPNFPILKDNKPQPPRAQSLGRVKGAECKDDKK